VKERLTGAIILVVLVVLLVPELLSGPKGPAAIPPAPGAASPSSEEPPLRSYTINLGDEHSQSQTANGAADSSGPPQPSVQAQPTTTPDEGANESTTWDSAAPTDQQSSAAGANPSASSPTNNAGSPVSSARPTSPAPSSATAGNSSPSAHEQQAAHGSTAAPTATSRSPAVATKPATSPPTPAPKVGSQPTPVAAARAEAAKPARTAAAETPAAKPHPTPAATEKPAAKPHAAAAEKPATAGGESGGWGVQLGVFGSKENAERLVLQARVKGFKASVSPITSGKNKMYRVRVGPAPDKSAAQELQTKLKAAGIAHSDAKVVPYS